MGAALQDDRARYPLEPHHPARTLELDLLDSPGAWIERMLDVSSDLERVPDAFGQFNPALVVHRQDLLSGSAPVVPTTTQAMAQGSSGRESNCQTRRKMVP